MFRPLGLLSIPVFLLVLVWPLLGSDDAKDLFDRGLLLFRKNTHFLQIGPQALDRIVVIGPLGNLLARAILLRVAKIVAVKAIGLTLEQGWSLAPARPFDRLTRGFVHREDVQHGIENAVRTFLRLFKGENEGKQLLQVGDPPIAPK